jgi:hypothetical protein
MPLVAVAVLGLVAAGFLTRRPYYQNKDYRFDLPNEIKQIEIEINADPERVNLHHAAVSSPRLRVEVHGYGWVKFNYHMRFEAIAGADTLRLELHSDARSYFAELDHALTLILPLHFKDRVTVLFRDAEVVSRNSDAKRPCGALIFSAEGDSRPVPLIGIQGHRQ